MRQRTINMIPTADGRYMPARVGLGGMETAMRSLVMLGRYRLGAAGMVPAAQSIQQMVSAAAVQYGVDPALALAVASAESGFNQNVVSGAGAIGVMQLMPATAAGLGVNPQNLQQNISGGVRYLAQLLAQFGDPAVAVAAYNAGPGNVSAALSSSGGAGWLALLPAETQNYVPKVLSLAGPQYVAAYQASSSGSSGTTDTQNSFTTGAIVPLDDSGGGTVDTSAAIPAIGLDTNTLLLLGALAVGGYLLVQSLSD